MTTTTVLRTKSTHTNNDRKNKNEYLNNNLAIIVIGASGDLAKRKTYPSLFNLYLRRLLPCDGEPGSECMIWGYGRSKLTHSTLRDRLRPFLLQSIISTTNTNSNISSSSSSSKEKMVDQFLSKCYYQRGNTYDDIPALRNVRESILLLQHQMYQSLSRPPSRLPWNYLFYLAIPPNIFSTASHALRHVFWNDSSEEEGKEKTWRRIILEKPFGRDLESYRTLSSSLSHNTTNTNNTTNNNERSSFREEELYRIDHYLGKKMLRSILPSLRSFPPYNNNTNNANNTFPNTIWNKRHVSKVIILLKEKNDLDGRGGYFDNYGIVRDVIQNHLLQLLALVAMEVPGDGNDGNNDDGIRDAKVEVLNHILKRIPHHPEDCILGQYEGYDSSLRKERTGGANANANNNNDNVKEKSRTPTFAAVRLYVENERWGGVPFVLVAGKALDENLVEVRLTLRDDDEEGGGGGGTTRRRRNELVMRVQPNCSISLTTNIQSVDDKEEEEEVKRGKNDTKNNTTAPKSNERKSKRKTLTKTLTKRIMKWDDRTGTVDDAYAELLHDAMTGNRSSFVRDDELEKSWEILTPLLKEVEGVEPFAYGRGSKCGPVEVRSLVPEIFDDDDDVSFGLMQSKL